MTPFQIQAAIMAERGRENNRKELTTPILYHKGIYHGQQFYMTVFVLQLPHAFSFYIDSRNQEDGLSLAKMATLFLLIAE